jgi:heme/copper-type cytochrome/quinol oxidase subunit 2
MIINIIITIINIIIIIIIIIYIYKHVYRCTHVKAVAKKAMDLWKSDVAGGLGHFSTRGAREPGRSSARLGQRQRSTLGDAQRKGVRLKKAWRSLGTWHQASKLPTLAYSHC